MNTATYLLNEHRNLRDQLQRLPNLSGQALATAFAAFATDLVMHAELEEDTLYPKLEHSPLGKKIRHAYDEHHLIDTQIDELVGLSHTDANWKSKLHVLEETLTHHLDEEEEEVFPKLDHILGSEESQHLAEDLAEHRSTLAETYAKQPPQRAQKEAVKRVLH